MLWSKYFLPTKKEVPQEAESVAHQLMLRAGLVRMLVAGVYSYLPAGLRVLDNIQNIIRQEMNAAGAQELLLSCLQPQELWDRSGRNTQMEEIMVRFTDRRGRKMCLGPTHEEVITDLVSHQVNSYKQLPFILYQIQTKFRDEIRPRFGLIRSCEFIMKDAYSFDLNEEGLDLNYKLMYDAYLRIFKRLSLNCVIIEADTGVMGGSGSHEFLVLAESGEDMVSLCGKCGYATTMKIALCPQCGVHMHEKKAIEIGHIFKLGTKYSHTLSALFTDEKGDRNPIVMGCYGIGVSRALAAIIETSYDADGIVWPSGITPFDVEIVPLNITHVESKALAFEIYRQLCALRVNVLLDDRDERSGVKFKDADLIGIPVRVIIGTKTLSKNTIELQKRQDKSICAIPVEGAAHTILKFLKE